MNKEEIDMYNKGTRKIKIINKNLSNEIFCSNLY